jgi:glucose-6-phosphate dehydrogenase assembly protein OpcA
VVVDSTLVPHTLEHLAALVDRRPERAVTDLSWTKITGWRDCVARLFDVPENVGALTRMESVTIRHAGASSAQAQLLAGWLRASTELDPAFEIVSDDRADMRSGSLVQVEIRSGEERFAVTRRSEGVARLAGERMPTQDVRLRVPHAPALLASELEIFGRDEVFERAVRALL